MQEVSCSWLSVDCNVIDFNRETTGNESMALDLKNIIRGIGSVMEISPVPREMHFRLYHPADSALESMARDFAAVGNDLRKVINAQTEEPQQISR